MGRGQTKSTEDTGKRQKSASLPSMGRLGGTGNLLPVCEAQEARNKNPCTCLLPSGTGNQLPVPSTDILGFWNDLYTAQRNMNRRKENGNHLP